MRCNSSATKTYFQTLFSPLDIHMGCWILYSYRSLTAWIAKKPDPSATKVRAFVEEFLWFLLHMEDTPKFQFACEQYRLASFSVRLSVWSCCPRCRRKILWNDKTKDIEPKIKWLSHNHYLNKKCVNLGSRHTIFFEHCRRFPDRKCLVDSWHRSRRIYRRIRIRDVQLLSL